jgi:hypothetical protein
MLVQTTQSYSSVQDAKAALEVLKKTPGFILGYLVPGKHKTSLVFLCNGPDGNVSRTQQLVDDFTNTLGAEVQPFAYLTTAIIQYPRSAYEREQAAQNAARLQELKPALSDRREVDRTALAVIIFELVKHLESVNSLDHLTPDSIEQSMSTWIVTGLTPTENAALPTW